MLEKVGYRLNVLKLLKWKARVAFKAGNALVLMDFPYMFFDLFVIHYVFIAYSTLNIVSFVYLYIK